MNTPMTTANDDELLSAFADDALSESEVRQVLSRLRTASRGTQHDAARRLERYALLGELMRAEADSPLFAVAAQSRATCDTRRDAPRDVVGSVMQQIATETAQAQPSRPVSVAHKPSLWGDWLQGWRAPALSMALAASVAGVMLVVVQDAGVSPDEPVITAERVAPVRNAHQAAVLDLTEPTVSGTSRLAEANTALDTDALPDAYLLQHLANAEGGPMRTLSSNVRLASYERP
jgi:negative regulator of sigma E activity